jgi:hypothetical protein
LSFVDPDGLDVDEACAESDDCKITIKINIVYDSKANGGNGLTKKQKNKVKEEQIAKAREDYAESNIELVFSESEGSVQGNKLIGGKDGALNVWATVKGGALSFLEDSAVTGLMANGQEATKLYSNITNEWNLGPFSGNSLEHEIAHNLLNHNKIVQGMGLFERTGVNFALDANVNTRLTAQEMGNIQQDFRKGTMTKIYAVPSNPAANMPVKK